MSRYTETVQNIRTCNAYELAGYADVHSPDTLESPGAEFLDSVRVDFLDRLPETPGTLDDDADHEIADGAVPIYTYMRWLTFTDLAAWEVDIEDLASGSGEVEMTALAGLALYQVARDLVTALAQEIDDALDADADEDTDEDETEVQA